MPAWDDGKIRAFAPETGRLMYVISNAHRIGVTAVATTSDCTRVISGGGEGEVMFSKAESFFFFCLFSRAAPVAYGSSQAMGLGQGWNPQLLGS